MSKRVVIIASGPTEQEALPHLLRHLASEDIALDLPVLVPPRHRDLRCDEAERLVLHDELSRSRIKDIGVPVLVAVAKWHLEAWFFADQPGLREYLGRSFGTVENDDPDAIINPKLRLKNLLQEPYTAAISREIAERLSSSVLGARSRSFRDFEAAIRNGHRAS